MDILILFLTIFAVIYAVGYGALVGMIYAAVRKIPTASFRLNPGALLLFVASVVFLVARVAA